MKAGSNSSGGQGYTILKLCSEDILGNTEQKTPNIKQLDI